MLKLIDIHSGYGKKTVLRGVNLEIQQGEIFVLIGLNGSGKSSLLRTALGLIKPTQGQIFIDNKELQGLTLSERSKYISLLDSQPRVAFSMSVRELLDVADKKGVLSEAALQAVDLEGFENKNILQLSSGEAHRAFIAHTLAAGSQITMFDEPFAHLDWRHQTQLIDSLSEWKDKYGTTFVLAVHELERAVQIADRIGVMNQGRIIISGNSENVFSSPETLETFAFQARIDENLLDGSKRLTLGRIKS